MSDITDKKDQDATKPHIIVFGNEKGGSGKSTAAMHVTVGLMREGFKVGTMDLDSRQGTFTRYWENRRDSKRHYQDLPISIHVPILKSAADNSHMAQAEDNRNFDQAMKNLADRDFIVIDTPGSDSHLSRLGHSFADTLITPVNDSFIDLDLLAKIDPDTQQVVRPSIYAEMIWEQRKRRLMRDGGNIDWIVMRNRLSHVNARNKEDIAAILEKLSRRIGFRLAPGFGERVIYRELFLRGLTMLDLREIGEDNLTMSHITARQEVRSLMDMLGIIEKSKKEKEEDRKAKKAQLNLFGASNSKKAANQPDTTKEKKSSSLKYEVTESIRA